MSESLIKALGELEEVHKAGKVNAGQRKYTYMTLTDLLAAVRPVLAKNGLAVTQLLCNTPEGHLSVRTLILDPSGPILDSGPLMFDANTNPQVVGSAVTYYKRYQLAALVGLAGDDDDDGGRAAAPARHQEEYAQTRPVQRTEPDRDEDPYYQPPMGPHTANMAASQKQLGAIRGISATLGVGQLKAGDLAHWVLKRDAPDRPDGLLLTKAEASAVIEALQGDAGKALAQEFLGTLV